MTRAWTLSITARHVDDRIRAGGGLRLLRDDYDHHTHRELAALLGNGPATIRTAPATFTRVVDIARDHRHPLRLVVDKHNRHAELMQPQSAVAFGGPAEGQ